MNQRLRIKNGDVAVLTEQGFREGVPCVEQVKEMLTVENGIEALQQSYEEDHKKLEIKKDCLFDHFYLWKRFMMGFNLVCAAFICTELVLTFVLHNPYMIGAAIFSGLITGAVDVLDHRETQKKRKEYHRLQKKVAMEENTLEGEKKKLLELQNSKELTRDETKEEVIVQEIPVPNLMDTVVNRLMEMYEVVSQNQDAFVAAYRENRLLLFFSDMGYTTEEIERFQAYALPEIIRQKTEDSEKPPIQKTL